jgi:hypothetical protein
MSSINKKELANANNQKVSAIANIDSGVNFLISIVTKIV